MEEAEPENQRRIVTKSSIKRKPFANLTNIVRKPYHTSSSSSFSQSKKLKSFTAAAVSPLSDSSIGSTQNPTHAQRSVIVPPDQPLPSTTQRLKPGDCLGDENDITYSQRQTTQKTRSNTKAATVPFYQTSVKKTRSNGKEGSMPLHSSTSEKIKDQEKGNQPSFDNKIPKNGIDTLIPHSTAKVKDKGKEICVQSSYPSMENTNNNVEDITMSHSLMKRKDKGKAIVASPNDHSMKNIKDSMVEVRVPLSGVKIKDKEKAVMGLNLVDRAKKDEGKPVTTPNNYHTLEKEKQSSCPPLLRTRKHRNGAEDVFKSKSQTDPRPNKKKKRCSSKEDDEKYALPQDFVDQQRAYFKEIDDFELEVEEV